MSSKVDLKGYEQTTLEGTVTAVYVMTLREWLTKAKKNPISDAVATEKFTREWKDPKTGKVRVVCTLDDPHVVVVGEADGSAIDAFFRLPKQQGYPKSNLKRFIEGNQLPFVELPKEAKKWLGKKCRVKVDGNGFLRWAV